MTPSAMSNFIWILAGFFCRYFSFLASFWGWSRILRILDKHELNNLPIFLYNGLTSAACAGFISGVIRPSMISFLSVSRSGFFFQLNLVFGWDDSLLLFVDIVRNKFCCNEDLVVVKGQAKPKFPSDLNVHTLLLRLSQYCFHISFTIMKALSQLWKYFHISGIGADHESLW